MKLAVLGPAGTFSEEAGQKYKKDAEMIYAHSVSEIFDMVESGKVDLGLVPIENQLNGTIGETLDNLYKKDLWIVDELTLPIKHVLAAQNEYYKKIVSHPQALGQCIEFIKKQKKPMEECSSTAQAMETAKKDSSYAAIGTRIAAERNDLKILRDLNGGEVNVTRFFIIGQKPNGKFLPSKKYKTSIAVLPGEDRPGLLFDILREFRDHDINLNKIESRPSKECLGEYVFYIDMEGNTEEENIEKTLRNLGKINEKVKVFGSYEKQY